MSYIMGIDTSAYTTSVCIMDENNTVIYDLRKTLKVKLGSRGLRQQEAIFQHLKNMPFLIDQIDSNFKFRDINSIVVSSRPRNIKESYMPVFLVGKNTGKILSKTLGCKLLTLSHQEGHIGSGLMSNKILSQSNKTFLTYHISGGTSELLRVTRKNRLKTEIIGGSLDISFGQLIDRIGVNEGLSFPAGKDMEKIALNGNFIDKNIPISIKEKSYFNLSGYENYFKNLSEKYKKEDIFHTLFILIARIIYKTIEQQEIKDILITGGVAANTILRKELNFLLKGNYNIYYSEKNYSTDNAVGLCYLANTK